MRVSLVLASIWIASTLIWLLGGPFISAQLIFGLTAALVGWLLLRPAGVARIQGVLRRR